MNFRDLSRNVMAPDKALYEGHAVAAVAATPTIASQALDLIAIWSTFGEVAMLTKNAGISPGGGPWQHFYRWRRVPVVNPWGVIHCFTPLMPAQGTPRATINTGSKQGIACPSGDTAYSVSNTGVKVLTAGAQSTQCRRCADYRASADPWFHPHRHD